MNRLELTANPNPIQKSLSFLLLASTKTVTTWVTTFATLVTSSPVVGDSEGDSETLLLSFIARTPH